MRALPFRCDRAIASAAVSASTSGIGSGSPTYGRDVSETVHRRHHGRRACSSSVVSRATSAWSRPGRRAARQAIGYGPQFIEHDGDVSHHADLIGCGMAGLSLLDGVLDVNGEGVAGRPGRIRQAPDGPHGIDDDRLPIGAAGEPDRGDIVLPAAEQLLWKAAPMRSLFLKIHPLATDSADYAPRPFRNAERLGEYAKNPVSRGYWPCSLCIAGDGRLCRQGHH
jgi:hypothetical protein